MGAASVRPSAQPRPGSPHVNERRRLLLPQLLPLGSRSLYHSESSSSCARRGGFALSNSASIGVEIVAEVRLAHEHVELVVWQQSTMHGQVHAAAHEVGRAEKGDGLIRAAAVAIVAGPVARLRASVALAYSRGAGRGEAVASAHRGAPAPP